jgi:2-oxoglutarate dehydrogenase E2 component (dihydrolipoamide succinyltransferase)
VSVGVELPALGESVVEGTVSRWLVKEGDAVRVDQPLVEVTTDKVDAEIPSPIAGVVEKILVPEGETVPVGSVLVQIAPGAGAAAAAPAPAEKAVAAAPVAAAPAPGAPAQGSAEARATPVARRMAEDSQVDLGDVAGSGVSGRVTKRDVAAVAAAPAPPAVAPAPAVSRAPAARGELPAYMHYELQEGDRVVPMTPLRRIVAEHMVLSKQTSPHVGTVAEVDMGGVSRFRDSNKRAFREANGYSLTFLPFIVHAAVRALREYPRLNASVVEDAIVEKQGVHIGVAVETDKGLVVPVVRHADRLSLAGLAAAIEDLSGRARGKKLSPDELRGGTFTVSNPGRYGNLYGFAIINQPQVGILRMGEIAKRPVVRELDGEDAIVIRPSMHLALSYDHRAVDGAPANGFLHRVRELLEEAEYTL